VNKSTFYSQVRRGAVVIDSRGLVDYAATRANLRKRGRPGKSVVVKKIHINWWVFNGEYTELFRIHQRYQKKKAE
jgi:hypothetical protein